MAVLGIKNSAFDKSTKLSAATAKDKAAAAKEFSATTNNPIAAPQMRVAPKTVQMQKGVIQDKGSNRKSVPKPFSPSAMARVLSK
jgi:propanediol dehydratase small subunit